MTEEEKKFIEIEIKRAKKYLDSDPHFANYFLRDLQILKELELDDLSWAIHKSENVSKNDVLPIIEALEEYLETNN